LRKRHGTRLFNALPSRSIDQKPIICPGCAKIDAIPKKNAVFLKTLLAKISVVVHPSFQARISGTRRRMMTQSQVAAHLADKVGITKKQAKSALDEITALVVRELKREGSLRLAGLGIFRKRRTKARVGRNPATGAQIKIPARTRLRFTPAKALKDAVLGSR
jgi:DNA-binding protein HU-beta